MRCTKVSSITISPDRQRQEFDADAMQELIDSIQDRGLLHPPVLREQSGKLYLVAGERRLRALKRIMDLGGTFVCDGTAYGEGMIPYLSLGELSPLEAEEAELDENLRRRDLTWQETASAHAKLHALRQAQKIASAEKMAEETGAAVAPGIQSPAATAQELFGRSDGAYQDRIRKEAIVAKHLDKPEVAKAKSLDEAFKILKAQETARQNSELAATVGATFNADKHTALNRDCLQVLREWAESSESPRFDVILTDPPYGMNAQDFGDAGGKMTGITHKYEDTPEAWRNLMSEWCALAFAVAKPQAHAYVFCDIDRFHELKLFMQNAGWYVFRTPFTVHKVDSGRVPLPDQGPRRVTEWLLYAIKGSKPVTHIYPDLIACKADTNTGHGAQKPVALYQDLLMRSVRPGDSVLDTFAGSGTIFPAAHAMKCSATGIERELSSYGLCLKRLQELKSLEQPQLF